MKPVFVPFLFNLLVSIGAFGQSNVIYGKAIYKYKFSFNIATNDTLTGSLYFNSLGESYYTTPLYAIMNVTRSVNGRPQPNSDNDPVVTPRLIDSVVVYRNTETRDYYYRQARWQTKAWIRDTLKSPKWTFIPKKRKIGRFDCFLAETRFAGRNYQAWYTQSVPVSSGPWKLWGLPGLIVELTDDQGQIYFGLQSIEISHKYRRDFGIDQLKSTAITKKEFAKKEQEAFEKQQSMVRSMGGELLKGKTFRGIELEDEQ